MDGPLMEPVQDNHGPAEPTPSPVERLLLSECEALLQQHPELADRPVVVIDEETGTISRHLAGLGIQGRLILDSRSRAQQIDVPETWRLFTEPGPDGLAGAGWVIHLLARPLEALQETAWHVARWADPQVIFISAAREKHLNRSMNEELARCFHEVRASRGAHKSRALVATHPRASVARHDRPERIPRRQTVSLPPVGRLELRAYGLTFGAARLDPGTALLLTTLLSPEPTGRRAVLNQLSAVADLGCGNGTITAALGLATDIPVLHAGDDSASAVRSTRQTVASNGLSSDRVHVTHANGLEHHADASLPGIALNPPFHDGGTVTTDVAHHLFEEAARTLVPGGRLWCVWNSHLRYRDHLERLVGATTQLARDRRFTVTESVR